MDNQDEALAYLVRNKIVRSSVVLSVTAATICFFFAFASLVVFSPTIVRIGPLLNITASEQAALLAMPSISGSLLRPLFSVLCLRYGTRALFIVRNISNYYPSLNSSRLLLTQRPGKWLVLVDL